ncbi:MAG: hypothetical protein GYA56_09480, partial [Geobacteraceae bacterium]|nr:hypothetical protein [Geobacteraceae bacterium]
MSLTPEIDKNGKQIHRWEKEVADFHERLKDHRSAMLDRFKPVVLMQNTPEIYQQLGVQDRPIEITPNAIDKILASKFKRSDGHGLPVEIAKEIPKALHNPLMVFAPDPAPEGKSRPERAQNSLVVLTTIEHNRKPLFIIIQMDTRSGRSNLVHRISSSYERPEQDVKKWIQKGLLRMMDKEKGLEWLRSTRLYMHADGTSIQSLTPDHTILFKSSGVKYLLIQQKPATQNDAPILLKAYVSGYNRMSPSGTLEFVANHYSSRVRHYSRLLGKAKTTADLHKIRKDRFGHLPNWGELPSSTKQMILNAEDEVHQYLTKQEEKAKADTPAEDRIDQSTWRQPRMFKSGLYLLRKSSPIANHPGYTLRTVVDSTGHQVHRWFRNGSGPADVNEHHHRQDSASAMRQAMVDVPMPTFGSNSPTNQQCLRRVNQLLALATQGDLDGISNFSTSRTRANYSRVADYREALLAAANNVREIPPPALGLPPEPSQVRGSNPNNGALISAQRKINRT